MPRLNTTTQTLLLLLFFYSNSSLAACQGEEECNSATSRFADKSYDTIANRADKMASWIDSFFGTQSADREAANSILRLKLASHWDEEYDQNFRVSLRGKVKLPGLKDRISLILSDDEEPQSDTQKLETAVKNINDDTDIAIQFDKKNTGNQRLDYRIGIRSSGKPKASVRYRLLMPYKDIKLGRFTQRIRFRGGEGFTSLTRAEQDVTLSDTRLLRHTVQAQWGEQTEGVEWLARTQLSKVLSTNTVLSYYAFVNGVTRPDNITQNYAVGLNYRKKFLKSWLFYQINPGYTWRKESADTDREGVAFTTLSIEIIFD